MSAGVITVVTEGTQLGVLARHHRWLNVQLSDGTVGWVIRAGVRHGAGSAAAAGSGAAIVGKVHGPKRLHRTKVQTSWTQTTMIRVNGLRVHQAPSLSSPVVATLMSGERVGVLGHVPGWLKVAVNQHLSGWTMRHWVAVTSVHIHKPHRIAASATSVVRKSTRTRHHAKTLSFRGGMAVTAGVRIHSGPSLSAGVIGATTPGMRVRILGYAAGFAHVLTSNGEEGWIASQFVGGVASSVHTIGIAKTKRSRSRRLVSLGTHVTATVRLRAAPGGRIIGFVAAGTRVSILRTVLGWDLIRLPSGRTGYVSGSFVVA